MKELKFTPENLERHLSVPLHSRNYKGEGNFIVTTRDEKKGKIGDVFHIEGVGNAVLLDCVSGTLQNIVDSNVYEDEGFTFEEYVNELNRIYNNGESIPAWKKFYVHYLLLLNEG